MTCRQCRTMKAMVLAAGEGTRLGPLTHDVPKVLLPVGDTPLLVLILAWLRSHGVSEVALNLHHLGNKIADFLRDGSDFGLKVAYSHEDVLLGTAGGVKQMQHLFNDTFVVAYGDVLADFDLARMIRLHQNRGALATVAVKEMARYWEVGVVRMDEDSRIQSFVEKPPRGSAPGNLGSAGVYVLEKEVLDYTPSGVFSDFAYDVLPKMLSDGMPVYGHVLREEDYLIDIGTPENYRQANEDMKSGRVRCEVGQVRSISG